MFNDPSRFIEEKLQKKCLSINTIRDGIMAALLLSLQKTVNEKEEPSAYEAWCKKKSSEIRARADEAFAAIDAPSEYPSLKQLKEVTASLKISYNLEQLPETQKTDFEKRCRALFEKFEDDL
ncbi:hypothetical protein MNBD_NITROSPIRAE01-209 [hydrothermal vent metagenome]|uniref:Uncharacterized protein n=1 Tax=hydrothermal vent metagenome TaxID=652676 RepID=A0A3B1DKV4_9ZZZZ